VKILNPENLRIPTQPGATPCLLGNQCGECGTVVFPKMPVCPSCRRKTVMEELEIGRTARLFSHTIAYVAPKGFTAPYFQAFVNLPEGPRIFSLVGSQCPVERGVLEDGMDMRLIVEPVADTPERGDELTYKYVPARTDGSRH
jgi:uncharacterized OB-fold protein